MSAALRPGELPSVPSQLIRLALADLAKVEVREEYTVDMGNWHLPLPFADAPRCSVCLAGAVIAQSLGAGLTEDVVPENFSRATRDALRALDYFRTGLVGCGLNAMGVWRSDHEAQHRLVAGYDYRTIPCYEQDAALFHAAMERLAARLEEAGL